MHRFHLTRVAPLSLLCLGGVASATPVVPGLVPLPKDLPAQCEPLARLPASAQIPGPQLSAHVSVANCMAEVAMNRLTLATDDPSINDLNAAVAPSLALLDNVIHAGDPYWQMIAEDAKRDVYIGMVVRARSSVSSRDARAHDAVERRIAPWLAEARAATVAFDDLARANPTVTARDQVIRGIAERIETQRPVQ